MVLCLSTGASILRLLHVGYLLCEQLHLLPQLNVLSFDLHLGWAPDVLQELDMCTKLVLSLGHSHPLLS